MATRTKSLAPAHVDNQIPFWPNDVRGLPNAMARSAMFNVSKGSSGAREHFKMLKIESLSGIEIHFTGEELRQDDEDVLLQLIHLGREADAGHEVSFTGHAMLRELLWDASSKGYDRLIECINRLKANSVQIRVEDPLNPNGRLGYGGSLIASFMFRESNENDMSKEWRVVLDPHIVKLFTPNSYSRVDWATRLRLTPMAKWLHSFYHTHQVPFPMKVETFHTLTGSKAKQLKHFRAGLKTALAELVTEGFLTSWEICPQTDIVRVVRRAKSRLEVS
jgi:hypothetical protein